MYLYRKSRPDTHFTVCQCARFTHDPRRIHNDSVNSICRYLDGTQGKGLNFEPNSDMKLNFYVDKTISGLWKHEDDHDNVCVKSRTGYVMSLLGFTFH